MKLNVILDLDNTLISTVDNDPSLPYYSKIYDTNALICARPYLFEFLEWLFDNCNVSVFTAADKDYALFIIENFILRDKRGRKLNRKLDFIFYRYHVNMGIKEFGGGLKDLRLLWDTFNMYGFNCSNTIIIDDSPDVKMTNPYNALLIYPFEAHRGFDDKHLIKVKDRLEYIIENIGESNTGECIFKVFPEDDRYMF
jgi:hypothetical protein